MTQSDSLAALWPALVAARRGFGALTKDAAAQISTSRSYRYSTLGQLLDVAMPSLLEQGLLVVQVIDAGGDGTLALRTRLVHAPTTEFLETAIPLRDAETPQALGSAVTYARRYALLALLAVAPVDDDDGAIATAGAGPGRADPTPPPRARRTPRPAPSAAAVPAPAAPVADDHGVTDITVAVVEQRDAKHDGASLWWIRTADGDIYFSRDGILAGRLSAMAGTGEVTRAHWQRQMVGERVVRELRGLTPANDAALF